MCRQVHVAAAEFFTSSFTPTWLGRSYGALLVHTIDVADYFPKSRVITRDLAKIWYTF